VIAGEFGCHEDSAEKTTVEIAADRIVIDGAVTP
jgi:hypothetical protein